jgi:hypothetical protein
MSRHVFMLKNIKFIFLLQKITILTQRTKSHAYDYLIFSVRNIIKLNFLIFLFV